MQKDTLNRIGLVGTVVVLTLAGCKELPKPGEFRPYNYVSIMPDENGYVYGKDNEAGIQGRWYTYESKGAEIDPKPYTVVANESGRICVEGKTPTVDDNKFDIYYGAGIGFHLCLSGDGDAPSEFPYTLEECPLKGAHHRFVGIAFDLDFNQENGEEPNVIVMFNEWPRDPDAFVTLSTAQVGAEEKKTTEKQYGYEAFYYDTDTFESDNKGLTNIHRVQSILFQVISDQYEERIFDFCISNVHAILHPDEDPQLEIVWDTDSDTGEDASQDAGLKPDCSSSFSDLDGGVLDWVEIGSNDTENTDTFEILKTEVTARQYELCKEHGCCLATGNWKECNVDSVEKDPAWDYDNSPANCVDWSEAQMFCNWVGGWLPSAMQWEKAALHGRLESDEYPWGNKAPTCDYAVMVGDDDGFCRTDDGENRLLRSQPVCSLEKGNTADGLCDMSGNVWEWVEDWYPADKDDNIPAKTFRMIKGGGYLSRENSLKSKTTSMEHPTFPRDFGRVGFRCVKKDD